MRSRAIHLIEAGIVTEQRSAGVADAPAALASAFIERFAPAKRVRVPFVPRDRWLAAARESCRNLADAVRASLLSGALPIVLGGECTVVAGSLSGAIAAGGDAELHLLYLDAHADFHTLATTKTHEVSGMCLAHLCGRSVAALLWPGAKRIAEDHVILVGARAMDPGEAGNLARTKVIRVPFDGAHPEARGILAAVRRKDLWLHLAVDLIDPDECPAVPIAAPGGPSLATVRSVLREVAAVASIRGVELCGYEPTKDAGDRLPGILADLVADAVLARV